MCSETHTGHVKRLLFLSIVTTFEIWWRNVKKDPKLPKVLKNLFSVSRVVACLQTDWAILIGAAQGYKRIHKYLINSLNVVSKGREAFSECVRYTVKERDLNHLSGHISIGIHSSSAEKQKCCWKIAWVYFFARVRTTCHRVVPISAMDSSLGWLLLHVI
jgi:hypothetical protein